MAKVLSKSEEFGDMEIQAPNERLTITRVLLFEISGVKFYKYSENTYKPELDDEGKEKYDKSGHVINSPVRANWQTYKGGVCIEDEVKEDITYIGISLE